MPTESSSQSTAEAKYEEMTMAEIMNGKTGGPNAFPGLIPLCAAYLEHIQCDETSAACLNEYLHLISQRSRGKLLTPATWMRRFVSSHPEYKQDSVVTQGIAYDLLRACDDIGRGTRECKDLLGDTVIKPITPQSAWDHHLKGAITTQERSKLLEQLSKRSCPDDGPMSLPSAPQRKRVRSLS